MDKILELMYKGIEKFNNSGIEEKPKKEIKKKYVENDVLKIAKIYLGNWKKFTKTGKTKEANPPIEYYIKMSNNPKKIKSSYKMNEVPKSFRLYYKVKAKNVKTPKETKNTRYGYQKIIPQKILDVYPKMPIWIDIMEKYFNSKKQYFNIDKIFPKKIITDDHERYSKRIKTFIEKVGNLGYYPDSIRKEYMDRRKNETYIDFKYNEKLKGNKEKMNQIMELDKIKKIINKFSYGPGNFKIEDIPKKMIEYLFETIK
jgi:ribosomal protein S19E (S16A)